MNIENLDKNQYMGTEIGPIRPPSEAGSLMLRVTRNCPWNKCRFCNLYKGSRFSIRKREHVLADIEAIGVYIEKFKGLENLHGKERDAAVKLLNMELDSSDNEGAVESALHWYSNDCKSVFLQDANSLILKTDDLEAIINRLKELFPSIERITSYARSKTVLDKSDSDLARLKEAGLDRIHIGMESGADSVLKLMEKGAAKEDHINAGRKVKGAGIELSEYYILGLGGLELSKEQATETADALNQIDPDFIRVRTLSVVGRSPLGEDVRNGRFTPINDVQGAEELLLFIKNLNVNSYLINNDHILNLLPEVTGKLPSEKARMLDVIDWFLRLSQDEQMLYCVGRRTGMINSRADMENPALRTVVAQLISQHGITPQNLDEVISRMLRSFI